MLLLYISNQCYLLQAQEICDNNIDDDNNGYVDCYDNDCAEEFSCWQYPPNPTAANCTDIEYPVFSIELAWQSAVTVADLNIVLVADIDGNGIPELFIQGRRGNNSPMYWLNPTNGAVSSSFAFPDYWDGQGTPAIGDIDNDGLGEIILSNRNTSGNTATVYAFEHSGTIKWVSEIDNGFYNQPNEWHLADFNQDGLAEAYSRFTILNAQTGAIYTQLPGNYDDRLSVAADILPDSFCSACSGLELVVANKVYSVDINSGGLTLQTTAAFGGKGFTAVADWDLDGDLDIIVSDWTGTNRLYIWDGQTAEVLYSFAGIDPTNASRSSIANFDDDPEPELVIKTKQNILCLDNNLSVIWQVSIQENGGGCGTSATLFDFNGDGILEVVSRDETQFAVYSGLNGELLYALPCYSATALEVPVIADVDGDGEAEIVTICGNGIFGTSGYDINQGRVHLFHSSSSPWMPTRRVWNQQGYFNVNINDNLSVPIQQQQQQLPFPPGSNHYLLNTFMAQYSPIINPAGTIDTLVDALITLHTACANGAVHFEICNQGNAILPAASPVAFYDNNPTLTNAALIDIWFTPVALPPGACQVFTHTLPSSSDSIFLVVNDYGLLPPPFNPDDLTTPAGINECEMNNNLAGMQWGVMPYLNPIISCQNGSIVAQIEVADTESQSSFSWSSGQTTGSISVTENGIYCVTITNLAGSVCTYTLCQTIDLPTVASVSIAGNTQLPPTSSTVLSVTPNFAQYLWSTGQTEPAITISQPGIYTVTVTDDWGCTASGSLLVEQLSENIDDPINDTIPPLKFLIPNAFSPNNDGVNDHFAVLTWGGTVTDYALFVYNRWGNLVFESHQLQNPWDGRFKNTHAPIGTYAYYGYIVFSNGQSHWFQGNVTLIR